LVSTGVADALITAIMIILVLVTLVVAGVRDWRCIGAFALWAPTVAAVQTANLTLPLALAVAVVWRFRDRHWSGLPVGIAWAVKLFLWPLAVWLLATGRRYQAGLAVVFALFLVVASWAAIGFSGLGEYPELMRRLTAEREGEALTLYAVGFGLGLPSLMAKAIWLGAGVAALAASIALGRRGDDAGSFCMAVAAAVLLVPVVLLHYVVLLAVPLAIMRPRFDAVWLLPLLLWVVPGVEEARETWQAALTVAVMLVMVGACFWRPRSALSVPQVDDRRNTAILSSR
jgi:hypothetical protein